MEESLHLGLHYGTPSLRNSFATQAIKTVSALENSPLTVNGDYLLSNSQQRYTLSTVPEDLLYFAKQSAQGSDALIPSSTDITPGKLESVPTLIQGTKASVGDLVSGINDSFSASINKGENAFRSSVDTVTDFVDSVVKNATTSADNAFSKAFSAVDQTGGLANNKITGFSTEINGVTSKAPGLVIDVLRRSIVAVENSLSTGASYIVYLYGSAKEFLPAEIRDTVGVYEDKVTQFLRPVGSGTQQVMY